MKNLPFRPNVCLLICNLEGKLFLGERSGSKDVWQFPQGGAEPELSLKENALKEAHEELGVPKNSLKVIRQLQHTHEYEFEQVPEYAKGKWCGQAQTFWCLLYSGEDKEITLDRYEQELSNWRWCTVAEVRELAEAKRLKSYEFAMREFEHIIAHLELAAIRPALLALLALLMLAFVLFLYTWTNESLNLTGKDLPEVSVTSQVEENELQKPPLSKKGNVPQLVSPTESLEQVLDDSEPSASEQKILSDSEIESLKQNDFEAYLRYMQEKQRSENKDLSIDQRSLAEKREAIRDLLINKLEENAK